MRFSKMKTLLADEMMWFKRYLKGRTCLRKKKLWDLLLRFGPQIFCNFMEFINAIGVFHLEILEFIIAIPYVWALKKNWIDGGIKTESVIFYCFSDISVTSLNTTTHHLEFQKCFDFLSLNRQVEPNPLRYPHHHRQAALQILQEKRRKNEGKNWVIKTIRKKIKRNRPFRRLFSIFFCPVWSKMDLRFEFFMKK